MRGRFFEGEDFKEGEFRALMPKYYPARYKKYIAQETNLLKEKLRGGQKGPRGRSRDREINL